MKRMVCLLLVCGVMIAALFAQTEARVNTVQDLDAETGKLASLISAVLKQKDLGTNPAILVRSIAYQNSITHLGTVISQNLINELSVLADGKYNIISTGETARSVSLAFQVHYLITGEIIEIGNIFRLYTRLIRTRDNVVIHSWQTDFQKTMYLMNLMNVSRSVALPFDMYEFDNIDQALEIALDGGIVSRTIHSGDDEDWFVFTAAEDVMLLFTVNGMDDFDSCMKIYDSNKNEIAYNDDYREGYDAGIVARVKSGETIYINVYGYDDETGNYALAIREVRIEDQALEPDNTMEDAADISLNVSQLRTFTNSDDEDWAKFTVAAGNYRITAVGEMSELDTYIELYDEDSNLIDEDDDSGEYLDACLDIELEPGTYYICIETLDEFSNPKNYTLTITE